MGQRNTIVDITTGGVAWGRSIGRGCLRTGNGACGRCGRRDTRSARSLERSYHRRDRSSCRMVASTRPCSVVAPPPSAYPSGRRSRWVWLRRSPVARSGVVWGGSPRASAARSRGIGVPGAIGRRMPTTARGDGRSVRSGATSRCTRSSATTWRRGYPTTGRGNRSPERCESRIPSGA